MASTLHSSIELSHRLRKAGHDVSFVSHRDISEHTAIAGIPFTLLNSDKYFDARADADPMPPLGLGNVPEFLRWIRRRRRIRHESLVRTELEQVLEDLGPDLLLIDIECHFAIIATADLGIPRYLVMFWFSIFRQAGLPPLDSSLQPATSWTGRLMIRGIWWRLRLASAAYAIRKDYGRRGLRARLRPVTYGTVSLADLRAVAAARDHDLAVRTDRSQWLRPYSYLQPEILCLNVWEMELPQVRRRHLHYVGPMIDLDRREARLDTGTAEAWDAYQRVRDQAPTPRRPLVYCSLGSFWSGDVGFLRRVIDVFVRRPEWDLVIGLGGKTSADALAPVPPNVLLLDWAPQVDVLRRADCAITHGGITTINECIQCNVPMVVYSTKHGDQDGCAVRVAFHRLGVMSDKDSDTSEQIERNIERCLSDPKTKQAIAAMRQVFRDYEARNQAVRLIEAAIAQVPD